jgi:cytosine/adenosine deaminase-related metal-dependent hydrolase
VAALASIARSQGYAADDLFKRLLSAATLGGARAMGLDVGPHRTGYLAVGARADLAFFAVPVTNVAETIEALVLHGEGTAAATVVEGILRHATATFTSSTGEKE